MALPPGITPKTVTVGIASFFDGSLAEGTATITAPVNVVHTPSNRPIFSSQMSHRFVDGETSFNLAPTDAPGLNRVDWTYKLNVVVSGALVQPEPVYFTLPAAGPDIIDLDSLVTVPSSAGTPIQATVVTSVNGMTGDVTVEGGTGGTATPDATTTVKGKVQLAGDLGGTAAAPTVPGLASKVNSSTYTQGIADAKARANHTGTQTSATISDFAEAVQDAVAALLGAGSNVILNYDDAANTLTVSATGSGGTGLDAEAVRDAIGVALVGVGPISVVVNDAADTITISTTATANSTDAQLRDRSTHTGTQAASTITGLATVATTGSYNDLLNKPAGGAGDTSVVTDRGIVERGVIVPKGALDRWFAARDASTTTRAEGVVFGDSTVEGIATGTQMYSWVQRLRERAIGAGYPDGGKGYLPYPSIQDAAFVEPDGPFITSRVGFGTVGDVSDPVTVKWPRILISQTAGNTVTVKSTGTALRIWFFRASDAGTFTYKVGAAAAVTVNVAALPIQPQVVGQFWSHDFVYLTGITPGTEVLVTNVSGVTRVQFDLLNNAGIVFHNHGISSDSLAGYFDPSDATGNLAALGMFGLAQRDQPAELANSVEGPNLARRSTAANVRKPSVAILAYGANDVAQGRTDRQWAASVELFIRMARNAGADPVIAIPPLFKVSNNGGDPINAGSFRDVLLSVALSHGAAVIDLDQAMSGGRSAYYSYDQDVHLRLGQYQRVGDFVWDKLLALPTPTGGIDVTAPAIPAGLTVGTKTANTVNLSWSAVTGAVAYEVFSSASAFYPVARSYGTSAKVIGLTPSTGYTFTVQAIDAAGNASASSSSVTTTTDAPAGGGDVTAPTAPTTLAAGTPTTTTIPLTWTASTDAVGVTGYNAYNNGTLLQSGLTGTSGTLTGLTAGTSYTITLRAYDAAGNLSTASNAVTVSTAAATGGAISDDFNRADTTSTAADPLGSTSVGAKPWTAIARATSGTKLFISLNRIVSSPQANDNAITEYEKAWVECTSPFGTVALTGVTSHAGGTGMGLMFHYVDANNYLLANPSVGDSFYVRKVVAGTQTFVSTVAAPTLTATSTIAVTMSDAGGGSVNYQFKVNGTNVGSPLTIADNAAGTKHGIIGTKASLAADSWSFTP